MNEPKIRFQGFEGEWKSGKVEEVTALQGGYAFLSSSFCKDGVPIVRIANILHSGAGRTHQNAFASKSFDR